MVIGKNIIVAAGQFAAVQVHVLQGQIAVILDEDSGHAAGNCAVFHDDGRIFEQLESIGFSSRRTNGRRLNRICMPF